MNAIREYWTAADAPCASLAETVPGMAELRAERWCNALSAFAFAATMGIGRTAQAYAAWLRSARYPAAGEFLARAVIGTGMWPDKLYDRPGSAAFAGVARAEFTDDIWQELPPGEGAPAVTIPVLVPGVAYTETPLLVAVDIIAIEPVSGRWASLADLHNGMLGTVPEDFICQRPAASPAVRLAGLRWIFNCMARRVAAVSLHPRQRSRCRRGAAVQRQANHCR